MTTKETTLNELGEMVTHVVEHIATKEDIAALRTDLKSEIAGVNERAVSIERELKSIRRDLNDVVAKVENITGYRKEIDHALERIAAIERHMGINRKWLIPLSQVPASCCFGLRAGRQQPGEANGVVLPLFCDQGRSPISTAFKSSVGPAVAGTWDNGISLNRKRLLDTQRKAPRTAGQGINIRLRT